MSLPLAWKQNKQRFRKEKQVVFLKPPGLISAYRRNPTFHGAWISVQALPCFPLGFALVHTAPLTQNTWEQEGEWQNLGATIDRELQNASIAFKFVFPANPWPVHMGIGCHRKWGRDISFAVKIPDHSKPNGWDAFFKRNKWVSVSMKVSDVQEKKLF